MKHFAKLSLIFLLAFFVTNCKKSSTSTSTSAIPKPRYFYNHGSGFSVADTRDIDDVKFYIFSWNDVTGKYEYNSTDDTTNIKELKLWPSSVTDPVGVGYNFHFLNRVNGSNTYRIEYGVNTLETSTIDADYPFLFPGWKAAFKIEGYANIYELRGLTSGPSYFFFDLEAGTYCFLRNDGTVSSDETIKSLILTPKGSLASSTLDFTKADAVIYDYDRSSVSSHKNNFYFIDYDAGKYLQISRRDDLTDETGRNTLVTSDWTPLSNLITGWKF